MSRPANLVARSLALLALTTIAVAQAPPTGPIVPHKAPAGDAERFIRMHPSFDPDRVLFDRPEGSDFWVSADRYKAGFGPDRVEFIPFLGSSAPQNYPVAFRLDAVSVDGSELAFASATPERRDDRIVYDRQSLLERYEPSPRGVEQSFVFPTLPQRGELRIRIAVQSSLPFHASGDDIGFANELGRVDYGRAYAIDGGGRSAEVARHWTGSSIEIVVPADFVATAAMPLVVDPLITGSGAIVHTQTDNKRLQNVDIAYDASSDRYMICCELIFSGTDSDVFCYEILGSGALSGALQVIDDTPQSWQAPRIANNNLANRYLIVAQTSVNNTSPLWIRGRTKDANSPAAGNQFDIVDQVALVGDKIRPDVCGDPGLTAPTYFTVVFEHAFTPTDHDIYSRRVSNAANPVVAAVQIVDNSFDYEELPAISDSMGAPIPDSSVQKAMIVWKRRQGANADIRARTITPSDTLGTAFLVAGGATPKGIPAVSSVTRPVGAGNYHYLVAFEQGATNARDIMVALCAQPGSVIAPAVSLHALETDLVYPTFASWDQFTPRVATDGVRFAVAYGEKFQNGADLDGRVTTVHALGELAPWTLGTTDSRAWPAAGGTVEHSLRIASRYDGAAASSGVQTYRRFGLAWLDENATSPDTLESVLYDGVAPTGGFSVTASACGGVTIAASGVPALGEFVSITTSGASLLAFGTPITPGPIGGCPSACKLGIAGATILPFGSIGLQIPPNAGLIGQAFGFQAFSLLGGPCFGFLSSSDTIAMIVQ